MDGKAREREREGERERERGATVVTGSTLESALEFTGESYARFERDKLVPGDLLPVRILSEYVHAYRGHG